MKVETRIFWAVVCSFLVGVLVGTTLGTVESQTQMVPAHDQTTWPVSPTYTIAYTNTTFTLQWWALVNILVNCNILASGGMHTCLPVPIPAMTSNDLNDTYLAATYCADHPTYCWWPTPS